MKSLISLWKLITRYTIVMESYTFETKVVLLVFKEYPYNSVFVPAVFHLRRASHNLPANLKSLFSKSPLSLGYPG